MIGKMNKKVGMVLLGMLCVPATAMYGEIIPVGPMSEISQQQGKITGTVEDNMGPVIGASVLVKGTTNGIMTDMDGKFELEGLKNGDVILISYIGYVTKEVNPSLIAKKNFSYFFSCIISLIH